ncbi:MAG TPA: PIG-L family deacetylase [Verrucomicrobiae bacterium]|nr:PIG-L family deacetylase [Verrucomicrobiae bacterium]
MTILRRPRHFLVRMACGAVVLGFSLRAVGQPVSPPVILQDLRTFNEMGSVLYVAAHPDDENTELIAYLARGRDYRTAYLSLTRGDGGQNVLGPDFGEKLGVARTQELLAARRLDGGRQYFTRAIDFGFSKDYRETLRIWNQEEVVSDIVRVMREFRPDVVVTRFSPIPGNTHGHHTASAVLAMEAFKLAGDPKAFPDQLSSLTPWQPKRILVNGRGGGPGTIRMDTSGTDSVLHISFAELAARSRAMHKTQGFGNFTGFGRGGPRSESFQLLDGAPATNDIMDGIDTTWNRVGGGAEIGKLAAAVIAQFDPGNPSASVPALLKIKKQLAALKSTDPVVIEKSALLDHILQECLGLRVETIIPRAELVPGETIAMQETASVSSAIPVAWLGDRYPTIHQETNQRIALSAAATVREARATLPAGTPLTQPYWLREEGTPGMFRVDDPSLIGRPENPPVFPIEHVFEVGGQRLILPDQPVAITTNSAGAEVRRRLDVIPPVSLALDSEVILLAPGGSHVVQGKITAARANLSGTLRLDLPAGWSIAPAEQPFRLGAAGDEARFKFLLTAPKTFGSAKIIADAEIGGVHYRHAREEINYSHIPLQLLQPLAAVKGVVLDLAIRGKKIGYLPGAGDSVADNLAEMGYDVTTLTGADLTTNRLADFDAVVIGVRAFNVRTDLVEHLPALFSFVEAGGNVIEQYNRPGNDLKTDQFTPYPLHLSNERVTDETAAMTFLAPDDPVLNSPNKITAADFDGWVQERGIYFPDRWDDHFTPILACHDPGEAPLKGSLLVAQYGKGHFVYTGLVFFRQLPAGVPGAYRLFANLVSLGK